MGGRGDRILKTHGMMTVLLVALCTLTAFDSGLLGRKFWRR